MMSPATSLARTLNLTLMLILAGILLASFGVQLFMHEEPCPLCLTQRLCMIGVGLSALMNLRFGINVSHYALFIFNALVGGGIALRQIVLHICLNFPTFGSPMLGLSLYTWSFIIFTCVILTTALLLLLFRREEPVVTPPFNILEKTATLLFVCLILGNIATVYQLCGLGICPD